MRNRWCVWGGDVMGTVKYTGPVASFHCPTNAEIRSLKVHFSPKQEGSGDPSPENVRPIVGWDGVEVQQSGENQGSTTNYEFGVLGKNKLSDDANDYVHNYGSPSAKTVPDDFRFENGEFSGTVPENTRDYCVHLGQIAYPPGTYTISCDYINNGQNYHWQPFICSYSNTSAWYSALSGAASTAATSDSGHLERTFTATQPFYVNLTLNSNGNTTQVAENKIYNLQLELGSTATTYEPYDPKHTVYGGWVDLITGEAVNQWNIRTISEMSIVKTTGQGLWQHRFDLRSPWISGIGYESNFTSVSDVICSSFTAGNADTNYTFLIYAGLIDIYDDTSESVEEFKEKYDQYHIAYPIKSELYTTYHLAPTELQTFLGQNNVWSNADYVEVEYDLHETQDILARKQFIVANQPHIVRPVAAPLQNFTTDVAAPLKECKVYFGPVQDLHGYDKPWPAGGGKNKLGFTYANNVANGTNRIVNFTKEYIRIEASGTTTTNSIINYTTMSNYCLTKKLPAGTYTFSFKNFSTNIANITKDSIYMAINDKIYDGDTVTLAEEAELVQIVNYDSEISWSAGKYIQFSLQIENGSTATSYEPYENICPISGWTGLEVTRCGKNMFDPVLSKQTVNTDGSITVSSRDMTSWFVNREYMYLPSGTYKFCSRFGSDYTSRFIKNDTTTPEINFSDNTIITLTETTKLRFKCAFGTEYPVTGWCQIFNSNDEYSESKYVGTTIHITFPATVNLFNEQWEQGNIEVGNNASSSTSMRTDFINVNPSTSYYLYTSRENGVFVFEYLEDGTYADKVNSVYTSHTFTTGSTTKKIRIVDRNSGTETVNTGINYPATVTYYEPYGTIYGGYVDLVKGEVVQEQIAKTFTILDSNQTTEYTNTIKYRFSFNIPLCGQGNTTKGITMCNIAPYSYTNNDTVHWYSTINNANGYVYVWLPKTFNNTDTITIVATLYTPQIIATLTPTQLKTLRGTNNIWSNTNDNIQVTYWKH